MAQNIIMFILLADLLWTLLHVFGLHRLVCMVKTISPVFPQPIKLIVFCMFNTNNVQYTCTCSLLKLNFSLDVCLADRLWRSACGVALLGETLLLVTVVYHYFIAEHNFHWNMVVTEEGRYIYIGLSLYNNYYSQSDSKVFLNFVDRLSTYMYNIYM